MFDESKLYPTDAPELRVIAPKSTMAHWRSEGRGPAFIKIGPRVVYRGRDLNCWLDSNRIEPEAA